MGFSEGSSISWIICKQSAPHSRQISTPTPHQSIFTGRMLFLTPNQQCQSTEGTTNLLFSKSNLGKMFTHVFVKQYNLLPVRQ